MAGGSDVPVHPHDVEREDPHRLARRVRVDAFHAARPAAEVEVEDGEPTFPALGVGLRFHHPDGAEVADGLVQRGRALFRCHWVTSCSSPLQGPARGRRDAVSLQPGPRTVGKRECRHRSENGTAKRLPENENLF